jgi:hypothetical protein
VFGTIDICAYLAPCVLGSSPLPLALSIPLRTPKQSTPKQSKAKLLTPIHPNPTTNPQPTTRQQQAWKGIKADFMMLYTDPAFENPLEAFYAYPGK